MKDTFSSIEALEARISPAALSAKLVAGVLKIAGDPVAPNIDITQSGSSIEVLDGAASLGVFDNVKAIDLNFTGGATVNLTLGGLPGLCNVAAHGLSTINVNNMSQLNGGLTVSGDGDQQTLSIGTKVTIGKSLTFKGGDGLDSISIANGGSIGGNLALTSVESGNFTASSIVTTIAGSMKVNNAGDSLGASFHFATATTLFTVSGGLSYVGGKLNDSFDFRGSIGKNAIFLDAAGDNSYTLLDGTTAHGSVTMTTGSGQDDFAIPQGTIDGNVTLKLGDGNNQFNFGSVGAVTVGGNVSFIGGSGDDTWLGAANTISVGKNVTARLGDGTNNIAIILAESGTKLSVITGSGSDSVSIEGTGASAAVVISMGGGNDFLIGSLLGTVKSASLNGGEGMDTFKATSVSGNPVVLRSFEAF